MNTAKNSTALESAPRAPALGARIAIGLIIVLFVVILVIVSLDALAPPVPVPANASPAEFSSARAMQHLVAISRAPHPTGSMAQVQVKDYILKQLATLGVTSEVQETSNATNIVAQLKGTRAGKALLLVGHYDSVAQGPGASDDGSAVAALLETIRALKAGAALRNDVIFLFSDGEEIGEIGANAFVYQHPLAKDVALVLNFEARGVKGPSIMFETSGQNGWLIREFAKGASRPVANSFAYDVYKLLPNDTDLTVFKNAGFAGLNFAFVDGSEFYHTAQDNLEHLDEHSLQHQGSYALSLAQHFGNLELENVKDSDVVYFNLVGSKMIVYQRSFVIPLAILAILLFLVYVGLGLRNKQLTIRGMTAGGRALLLSIAISCLLVTIFRLIKNALPSIFGNHDRVLVIIAALAIVVVTSIVYLRFSKPATPIEKTTGGMCGWLILTLLTALFMKGSSYLSIWPLLFNTIGLAIGFWPRAPFRLSPLRLAVLGICAAPMVLLVSPVVYFVFLAVTFDSLIFSVLVSTSVALLVVPFVPHLEFITYN
ncbi:MAG TPA: M20/M25/M40 family metallo-hydrolase [Pyrinomonadaceae bacterium]